MSQQDDAATARNESTATLIRLIESGDEDGAVQLLDTHADAATGYGDGGTSPVLAAAYRGQQRLLQRLVPLRELDLFEAAVVGDEQRVAHLVKAVPSNLNARTPDGWTALHLAAFFGHRASGLRLLDAGADLETRSSNTIANTPLCAALAGRCDASVVELLVSRGADVNARAESGVTPLHLAASRGAGELVDLLLARGANREATLDDGRTPSALARERGHPELAERLAQTVD